VLSLFCSFFFSSFSGVSEVLSSWLDDTVLLFSSEFWTSVSDCGASFWSSFSSFSPGEAASESDSESESANVIFLFEGLERLIPDAALGSFLCANSS
jgi:hypothetical protein